MSNLRDFVRRHRSNGRAGVMGVLNLTPDSFFDGGAYTDPHAMFRRVDEMIAEGADIIDVGGESTRPASQPVTAAEQQRRVLRAIEYAVRAGAVVSIDTTLPEVAEAALGAGAALVNDVSNLSHPELARVVARHGATLLLSHSRGSMADMAGFSEWPDHAYDDVVADALADWRRSRDVCLQAGMDADDVWLDPGLGFTKNARHTLALLRRTQELRDSGAPLVVGPSRKSFIAAVTPSAPADRLGGTIAACLAAAAGGADFLRVHDIAAVRQALAVHYAIETMALPPGPRD